MNTGLIIKSPGPSDWRFGGFSAMEYEALQQDGQWKDYLPVVESQHAIEKWKFDSMACVSFSANNALETMYKRRFDSDINLSDRFLAKVSGTTTSGNWLVKVADAIRDNGFVLESDYPFLAEDQDNDSDYDWADFYKDIPEGVLKRGRDSLEGYDIHYEWVGTGTADQIMYALRFSPLQITLRYASQKKAVDGIIPWDGKPADHATLLVGYKRNEYSLTFDTYSPYLKKVAWDYPISDWSMRFNINPKTMEKPLIISNALIFEAEGAGRAGLFLDGKIIIDELPKVLLQYQMRNKSFPNTRTLTTEQFDLFEHQDFKGNNL